MIGGRVRDSACREVRARDLIHAPGRAEESMTAACVAAHLPIQRAAHETLQGFMKTRHGTWLAIASSPGEYRTRCFAYDAVGG